MQVTNGKKIGLQAAEADEVLNDSALQKRTTSLLSPGNGKNIVFFFLVGRINLSAFSRGGKCFPRPQNEETSPFSTLFNSNGSPAASEFDYTH